MKRIKGIYLATLAVLLSPMAANADSILYLPDGGGTQVQAFEPIGQSFVAEDELIEAGLNFLVFNPVANSDDILYQLFAGVGTGGALVASQQFGLADGFDGFFLVDFSSTPLLVGDTYSLVASVVGSSQYWGVRSTSDAAAPQGIRSGLPSGRRYALSVNPVPEPGTMALFGIGLAGMGLARRRRKA